MFAVGEPLPPAWGIRAGTRRVVALLRADAPGLVERAEGAGEEVGESSEHDRVAGRGRLGPDHAPRLLDHGGAPPVFVPGKEWLQASVERGA